MPFRTNYYLFAVAVLSQVTIVVLILVRPPALLPAPWLAHPQEAKELVHDCIHAVWLSVLSHSRQ